MSNYRDEVTWHRSSFCANGACLEASRAGRLVLVRDSKQPPAAGLIQQWARDEWVDLLHSIVYGYHHVGIDVIGDGTVSFGLHRHEKLTFTDEEWDAFVKGVRTDEFKYELLPTYASTLPGSAPSEGYGAGLAQVGPGVGTRSDQVVTGAGAIAVPPVPVTADRRHALVFNAITRALAKRDSWVPLSDRMACTVAVLAELDEPAGTLAGLGADQIVDIVRQYGEACMAGADNRAADLLDAIRGALVPVTAVEFERQWGIRPDDTLPLPPAGTLEPRWGSGPLVKHILETPSPDAGGEVTASLGCAAVTDGGADPVPVAGTGSAEPLDVPCWICPGAPLFRKSEMAAHLRTHEGNGIGLR